MRKLLLPLLLLISSILSAQQVNTAKMDSLLTVLEKNDKAMGSLTLSKNGRIVYSRTIGFAAKADSGKHSPDPSTRYRIGSITKTFTATMIFQLAEENKISLNDPISKWFPGLPLAEKVQVRHLLYHSSGIYSISDHPDYLEWNTRAHSEEQLIGMMGKKELVFEPGSKNEYSNSNYILLGYLIEKIAGKPYSEVLREKITSRIGLANTYYPGNTDSAKREAVSFVYHGGWVEQSFTHPSVPHGAGAIVSTSADLVKFLEALFSYRLVAKESLSQMTTLANNYGMGIFQFPFDDKKAWGHTGGIDGFGSMAAYFPDDSLAVAYCGNGATSYPINDIMIGALSIYFNRPYKIPEFKAGITVSPEVLDKLEGVYSSKDFPLKITIKRKGAALTAQATGQSSFVLEATSPATYTFDQAGIVIEFPGENKLVLMQGGGKYVLTREK